MEDSDKWTKLEQHWWQDYYKAQVNNLLDYKVSPQRPQGLRCYYCEMLFRHMRTDIKGKIWIDIGAGDSYLIINLMHPTKYDYQYIATDISAEGLKIGKKYTNQTPIVCNTTSLPFKPNCASIVSGFGILHHIPNWQQSLRIMVDLLQPGGYLLLFEAVTKPRIFGKWRSESYTAKQDSPHEGEINNNELIHCCSEQCDILIMDYSDSPLRFFFVWFLKFDTVCLRSYFATRILVFLDKLWLNTCGKLIPSLGAKDITILLKNVPVSPHELVCKYNENCRNFTVDIQEFWHILIIASRKKRIRL
jgi:SAM-dependent methyltransferase